MEILDSILEGLRGFRNKLPSGTRRRALNVVCDKIDLAAYKLDQNWPPKREAQKKFA